MSELQFEEDLESIDSDELEVYEVGAGGDPPQTTMSIDHVRVRSPFQKSTGEVHKETLWIGNRPEKREYRSWRMEQYDVEIEYESKKLAVTEDSVRDFLYTFEDACITQESMVTRIKSALSAALDTSSVFVEVISTDKGGKRTRTGGVL